MTQLTARPFVVDRRTATRYPVRDRIFITFRPAFDVVGCLVDLSHDGLAFEYTAFERSQQYEKVAVDIFCQPRRVNLTYVPCRVIYTQDMKDAPSFCGFRTKRCGLQFGRLSQDQAAQIHSLLRSSRVAFDARE
ncbi:MAG: PilZ domain-containing protein [Syntrophobacteraceae bacterium]